MTIRAPGLRQGPPPAGCPAYLPISIVLGAVHSGRNGGAEGSRTPDLLIANEALYQLSYGPRKARNNPLSAHPVKRL
jgi:hypothetical protein